MGLFASTPVVEEVVDYKSQTSETQSIIVIDFVYKVTAAGANSGQRRVIRNSPKDIENEWKDLRKDPLEYVKKNFPNSECTIVEVKGAQMFHKGKDTVSF